MKRVLHRLPPVGNHIITDSRDASETLLDELFHPYHWQLCDSGTSALASSLNIAKQLKECDQPEVLMPAYGCPDIVAAARFLKLKIKFVDFEENRPWMNLDLVAELAGESTIAIVAVNFLGIPERIDQLTTIAKRVDAVVIDDSAQAFPVGAAADFWSSDIVTLSFGRGKPISVLDGGAILCRDNALLKSLATISTDCNSKGVSNKKLRLIISLYNFFINPRYYWIADGFPFLRLGETLYEPMHRIAPMSRLARSLLLPNVDAYRERSRNHVQAQVKIIIDRITSANHRVLDLPELCQTSTFRPLLRYPLLLSLDIRDRKAQLLNKAGLGCSTLYGRVLPDICGIKVEPATQGYGKQARLFASGLLTLPIHDNVRASDLKQIENILIR